MSPSEKPGLRLSSTTGASGEPRKGSGSKSSSMRRFSPTRALKLLICAASDSSTNGGDAGNFNQGLLLRGPHVEGMSRCSDVSIHGRSRPTLCLRHRFGTQSSALGDRRRQIGAARHQCIGSCKDGEPRRINSATSYSVIEESKTPRRASSTRAPRRNQLGANNKSKRTSWAVTRTGGND